VPDLNRFMRHDRAELDRELMRLPGSKLRVGIAVMPDERGLLFLDETSGRRVFVKPEDFQRLLFPGIADAGIESLPFAASCPPQGCAMLGDERERIFAQPPLEVVARPPADERDPYVFVEAE